ncbi:MAG: hypothetical protein SGCHY_004652, partial [Lobulomycetales sp.]
MEIEIYYRLVLSSGASYKDSSVDRVSVNANGDIIHLRDAVKLKNHNKLSSIDASQLTVYATRADLLDINVQPLEVDVVVSGLGKTIDSSVFVVVPDDTQQQ